MSRRFRRLAAAITKLLVEEDALGQKLRQSPLVIHQVHQFAFHTDPQKLQAFQQWLQEQVSAGVLQTDGLTGQPWMGKYVQSAYRQGMLRAYTDSTKAGMMEKPDWYAGSRQQFLQTAFGQPETMQKIQLLATRSFEELKGVTATMSQQMGRILAKGLAAGMGASTIARDMVKSIGALTRSRAQMIARTEIINAHAEGQLDAFRVLGVKQLGIQAEWSTAGDALVCPECAAMEGKVYNTEDAHGLIPLHPNCRCAWIPTPLGEVQPLPAPAMVPPAVVPTIPRPVAAPALVGPPATPIGTAGLPDLAAVQAQTYKILKEQIGGTTGAQLVEAVTQYRIQSTRTKYVLKQYLKSKDPQLQVQNEYIANRILQLFHEAGGGRAPASYLGRVQGKLALFNKYLDDVRAFRSEDLSWVTEKARKDFVLHAWLANWDVAGLSMDNLAVSGKTLYYLDNGGSLLFRAQGGLKGALFGDKVDELSTLLNPSINPSTAKLFGEVTDKQMVKLLDDFIERFKDPAMVQKVTDIVKSAGMDATQEKELLVKMWERFQNLINERARLQEKIEAAKTVKKAVVKGVPGARRVYVDPKELSNSAARIHLEESERKAIRHFTADGYREMNRQALRGEADAALDTALEKMPGYQGWSLRGLHDYDTSHRRWNNWATGKWAEVKWDAYSSSTIDRARAWGSSDGILFVIKNKGRQGAYVAPRSTHSFEAELLYKRGARFQVQGYYEGQPPSVGGAHHNRILVVEEVEGTIPETQLPPHQYTVPEIEQLLESIPQHVS